MDNTIVIPAGYLLECRQCGGAVEVVEFAESVWEDVPGLELHLSPLIPARMTGRPCGHYVNGSKLTRLRDERREAEQNGRRPGASVGIVPTVEDLAGRLRESVKAAKERRKAGAVLHEPQLESDIPDEHRNMHKVGAWRGCLICNPDGTGEPALNPECQQGKHPNCDGKALHPDDTIGTCECPCHRSDETVS